MSDPAVPRAAALAAAALVLSPFHAAAHAELRLPDDAFVAPPACRVAPFGDDGLAQALDDVDAGCGGRALRVQLESTREQPTDAGPSLLRARADRVATQALGPVLATVQLAWSAVGEVDGRLHTEKAVVAAGGVLKLDDGFALRAQLGLDGAGDTPRGRARVAGLWQPTVRSVVFAEWSGQRAQTERQTLGLRWWLMPGRVALDVAAHRAPWTPGWVEPRVGLTLPGLGG